MKTIRLTLLLAVFAGCATTSDRIGGKYGVFFESDLAYDEQIVTALRDRLSSVDVVASPADDAYDAVIVLSRTATGNFPLQPDIRRVESTRSGPRTRTYRVQHRMELLHYAIVRRGSAVSAGEVHVLSGYPALDITDKQQMPYPGDQDSARTQQQYARGIEVARAVEKALKDNS